MSPATDRSFVTHPHHHADCPADDREHLAYLTSVLGVFAAADFHDGGLYWHVENGRVRFSAMCSDTFHWASADAEDIAPDDVPLLQKCLADLQAIDAEFELPALFAARKRGMRPMSLYTGQYAQGPAGSDFDDRPALVELFRACGPERTRASEG